MAVIEDALKCPICKREMIETEKSFQCRGKFIHECEFFMPKVMNGKTLSDTALKNLSQKGESGLIRGFVSKNEEKYDAYLYVDKKDQSVKMKFTDREETTDRYFVCVKCGKRLKPVKWGYACEDYPKCKWSIGELFGVSLEFKQIRSLLRGDEVYIRGMKSKKTDKMFSAYMILNRESGYVEFAKNE